MEVVARGLRADDQRIERGWNVYAGQCDGRKVGICHGSGRAVRRGGRGAGKSITRRNSARQTERIRRGLHVAKKRRCAEHNEKSKADLLLTIHARTRSEDSPLL